ncbi:hypothetical protein IU501_22580 [Nocardia otitidiscaviarum]|uniref:hypothetical protein n=1 Tax=Nocardia otitidiscaviarum TaxID=1823 RepID=UPI0004A767DD|nr:hypothetical protein [Nocardia otitidiscaviarum]MBF6135781.1 hypothetical protein [Nocardia otitidiscaviarum]MBF6483594.1 hypothetical protein [Nocardia otitidiscaviarum]
MSDDAAQKKTTEDDSTAGADAVGSADTAATEKIEAAAESKADAGKADAGEPKAPEVKVSTAKSTQPTPPPPPREPQRPAAGSGSGGGSLPLIAAFTAGVLLVAAIATGVWFFLQNRTHENELAARDEATAAACEFGKAVSSYDAANLGDYFDNVKSRSTGQWGQFFSGAADTLETAMKSVNARSTLDEIHCAYESGDENKASVVLIITQVRSNSVVPQPDMLTVPGVAEMEKKDGKWLVANFDSPTLKGLNPVAPTGPEPGQTEPEQPAPDAETPAPGN